MYEIIIKKNTNLVFGRTFGLSIKIMYFKPNNIKCVSVCTIRVTFLLTATTAALPLHNTNAAGEDDNYWFFKFFFLYLYTIFVEVHGIRMMNILYTAATWKRKFIFLVVFHVISENGENLRICIYMYRMYCMYIYITLWMKTTTAP